MCSPFGWRLSSLAVGSMPDYARSPILIERLGRDHARIAEVVDEFSELAATVQQELDWARLLELVEFLGYFADRIHHPLEDRLFDHLLMKGLTPTDRHLVFRNLGQHQKISSLTESVLLMITQALKGATIDIEEFRDSALDYVSLQRRHMRFEEIHLFPLLEAEFENSDWNILMGSK
jgi:hemerythrin-like domain-containing protein